MKRLRNIGIILAVFTLFGTTAYGVGKQGGTLTYGIASSTVTVGVDPHVIQGDRTGWVLGQVCEGLLNYDQNMNIVPWLADSWEISEDGRAYTFHLAKGVTFHNGREMTAEDVKFSFERILDPNTGSRRRTNLEVIESMGVLDQYTIKVNLKTRFSPFLTYLVGAYGAIIPKESLNEEGKISHPVGTGPFKFVEWAKNDHLTLTKNGAYWRPGVPLLDTLVFKPLPDEAVRLTALRTGAVDIIHSLPEKMLPVLAKKEQKEFTLKVQPGVSWRMLIMNNRQPPFDNVKLRQAVHYALDRQELMMALTWGFGTVKNQIWPADSFWHMDAPAPAYDPEKAKALLKEAGYPDGIEILLEVKPGYLPVAEVVQDQLNRVGFRVKLGVLDWASLKPKMKNYEYQLAVSGAGWYSDPDARYGRFYSETGPANYFAGGYKNDKVTELLQKGREEVAPNTRKAIYAEVFSTLSEEVPHLMLFHLPMTHAWRKDVKGFSVSAQGDLFFAEGGLPYTSKE